MEADKNIMPDMNWHPIERIKTIGRFVADHFVGVPYVIEVEE